MSEFILRTFIDEEKIKESIVKIKEIDIIKQRETNNFEKISVTITNRNVIQKFLNFFTLLYKDMDITNPIKDKISIRVFLTTFMIIYEEKVVFNEKGPIEEKLSNLSKKILENFDNILNDYDNKNLLEFFKKNFNEFTQLLHAWKTNDKSKLLLALYSAYQDLIETQKKLKEENYENDTDKETSKLWVKEISNQKKLIENEVRKIGGDESIEKFLSGELILDFAPDEFKERIVKNLQKAYWENIKDELSKTDIPKNLIQTLNELKNKIKKLVPSRDDLHNKWEKEFKIEYLSYKFEKIEDRNDFICENVNKLLDIIIRLESKERNASIDKVKEQIKDRELNERIVELIYQCYIHIDFIYLDIENLKKRLEEHQKK